MGEEMFTFHTREGHIPIKWAKESFLVQQRKKKKKKVFL
jgi:hypothetical protein